MGDRRVPPAYGELEHGVLHTLLETLDLGNVGLSIVAVDVDPPEYIFVSRGAAALAGYSVEEFVRIPIWELFAPAENAALRARHR